MKIKVINGPNLNLLGLREPDHYGNNTYDDLTKLCYEEAKQLGIDLEIVQSNHEGAIVDEIQKCLGSCNGIIINPAAYTHTSIAILDALKAVNLPAVEVHISDVDSREEFRKISYAKLGCIATVKGEGIEGYGKGLRILKTAIDNEAVV